MILPLNQQVCSLESAKRLKELGVRQESLYHWVYFNSPVTPAYNHWELHYEGNRYKHCNEGNLKDFMLSAFTASELGVLLPKKIGSERLRLMRAENGRWVCTYGFLPISPIEFNNESEARAKMLIYLLENNLTTLESVNVID